MVISLLTKVVIYLMYLICFSALLGLIQIGEYTSENDKMKKFLSYLKVAIIFLVIGISLGRVDLY